MNLYLAYEAAQTDTPYPEVTLILGDYKWKVHGEVLVSSSDFFKKALEGQFQEANSKKITLHDDEPWIIARIIQCLYGKEPSPGKSLERIMIGNQGLENYSKDKSDDSMVCLLDTLVKIINTADKYLMYDLINKIPSSALWIVCEDKFKLSEFFDRIWSGVTCERLGKYEGLKSAIAKPLSKMPDLMRDVKTQEWLYKDSTFGMYLTNACAAYIERLETEVIEWKTKAHDAEDKLTSGPKRKRIVS